MKFFILSIGVAALLFAVCVPALRAQDGTGDLLASYRNTKRVLLVFTPTEKDATYLEQRALWKGEEVGFKERQLIVLPLMADSKSLSPETLGKRFNVDPLSFHLILIGKDGHDAYRSDKPVAAQALYDRIDAMPMRREEMKRQKQKA